MRKIKEEAGMEGAEVGKLWRCRSDSGTVVLWKSADPENTESLFRIPNNSLVVWLRSYKSEGLYFVLYGDIQGYVFDDECFECREGNESEFEGWGVM